MRIFMALMSKGSPKQNATCTFCNIHAIELRPASARPMALPQKRFAFRHREMT